MSAKILAEADGSDSPELRVLPRSLTSQTATGSAHQQSRTTIQSMNTMATNPDAYKLPVFRILGTKVRHSIERKMGLQHPSESGCDITLPFTRRRNFNTFMATVIGINGLYLGIETDYEDDDQEFWSYVEAMFTSIFCIELALRLYCERKGFWNDRWNNFDVVLVLLACLDTFFLEHVPRDDNDALDLVTIGRTLRLVRMARIVRLLRYFKTLWLLIIGVADAMRALVWAWLLILLVIFVFGIFMTRALGRPHGKADRDVDEQFGSVLRSMFTMFQIMTLEGWASIARKAMDYEPWIWIAFIIFLLLTTFSIMNVIVAVIVEGTLELAKDRKSEQMKRAEDELQQAADKVTEVFRASDTDADGEVTKADFLAALQRQDVASYLENIGIDLRQAENLFEILDYDDSGSLDAIEFNRGLLKARGDAQAQDVLAVQCELWRYELRIKQELQKLCIRVNTDMSKVDEDIEKLGYDIMNLSNDLDFADGSPQTDSIP